MGNINNNFQKNIHSSEKEIIIIKGEKVEQSKDIMKIKFEAKTSYNDYINFKGEKNKIYYEVYSEPNILLYRSEYFNEQSKFSPVKIP